MTNDSNIPTNEDNKQEITAMYALSDDVIVMLREVLQLSLLTQTNLVDNYRALRLEVSKEKPQYLIPAKAYMESYNAMITELETRLTKQELVDDMLSVDTKATESSPKN